MPIIISDFIAFEEYITKFQISIIMGIIDFYSFTIVSYLDFFAIKNLFCNYYVSKYKVFH